MMIMINWDCAGSNEVAEKAKKARDKQAKKMAEMSEGVEFLGSYIPMNLKWHYTYFFKVDSQEAWSNRKTPEGSERDRAVWTHGLIWQFA